MRPLLLLRALVSKMAADIFEHYDTDSDGLLKHKVPPPHEPRNPALIWGGVGGWGGVGVGWGCLSPGEERC